MRYFSPRQVLNSKGAPVDASWEITNQTQANGMAYYLFDEGKKTTRCSTCEHPNSTSPFPQCIVPTV